MPQKLRSRNLFGKYQVCKAPDIYTKFTTISTIIHSQRGYFQNETMPFRGHTGSQKVCGGMKDLRQNGLDSDITYAILSRYQDLSQFTHFLGFSWQKIVFFGQKHCFLSKKCTITWYILHIILGWSCNFCNDAQKGRICRKNSKYALDENFYGHFCPRRKAANFCHLGAS